MLVPSGNLSDEVDEVRNIVIMPDIYIYIHMYVDLYIYIHVEEKKPPFWDA